MKYKDRYVLAEGYPVEKGFGVALSKYPTFTEEIEIPLPDELYNENCPKYRLVLEKVKNTK
jgi:hypothetical protein